MHAFSTPDRDRALLCTLRTGGCWPDLFGEGHSDCLPLFVLKTWFTKLVVSFS